MRAARVAVAVEIVLQFDMEVGGVMSLWAVVPEVGRRRVAPDVLGVTVLQWDRTVRLGFLRTATA